MAEPIRPDAGKQYGQDNWLLATVIASPTGAPTVAEMTAVSTLDITRMLFASSGRPTANTNLGEAPPRVGDTDTYQRVGKKQYGGGELRYAINDQAAAGSDPKKLYEKILAGGNFKLINRRHLGRAVAPAAGQFVHTYPIELGTSDPVPEGDAEFAEGAMTASFAITGPPSIMVAVLA
jgi:hypothetical protein